MDVQMSRSLRCIFMLGCTAFASISTVSIAETAVSGGPKAAQTTTDLNRQCIGSDLPKLLDASFDFNEPAARDFPLEISAQAYRLETYAADRTPSSASVSFVPELKRAPEGGRIVLKLMRSAEGISAEDWQKSYLLGLAVTNQRTVKNKPDRIELVSMPVVQKDAQAILVDVTLPKRIDAYLSEDWTIIPVLCGGATNKVLGYASAKMTLVSSSSAWLLALTGMLGFWLIISYAAWQLNKTKLDKLWDNYNGFFKQEQNHESYKYIWKILESVNPVFISQDSLGYGSLARFQILIFTSVVGLVLLYIFIHSAVISNVSNAILVLLGVTVAGGTFARATGDWRGISVASRQWLLGTNILRSQSEKPRWSDLFETQGEIDVAKIQALLFTILICVGILASGITGLSSFTLPDQVVYLSMISQGTYVFGKLLPADSRKKVEEDLEALRISARNLASSGSEDPPEVKDPLRKAFAMARETAKRTLQQTYADRFDDASFDRNTAQPSLQA